MATISMPMHPVLGLGIDRRMALQAMHSSLQCSKSYPRPYLRLQNMEERIIIAWTKTGSPSLCMVGLMPKW